MELRVGCGTERKPRRQMGAGRQLKKGAEFSINTLLCQKQIMNGLTRLLTASQDGGILWGCGRMGFWLPWKRGENLCVPDLRIKWGGDIQQGCNVQAGRDRVVWPHCPLV